MSSNWTVGIVIPARNEADRLGACLRSIDLAVHAGGGPASVVVVLDACTDDTAAVVANHRSRSVVPTRAITIAAGFVGVARAVGAAELITEHEVANLWLATTDADSTVCRQWVRGQLRHRAGGADVVAGTVTVGSWAGWGLEPRRRYQDSYARHLEPDGHGHVHGANLGVRATLYQAIGGFPAVGCDEDVALVRAARAAGASIAWATDLPVRTSARLVGRAPGGFATTLRRFGSATLAEA